MSGNTYTIKSKDLKKFVDQICFFLKNGCDLLEDGYEVTEKDGIYSYSQVIILKTDKAIIHFYPDGSPGYYGYNAKEYMDYGDREFEWYTNGQLKSEKVYGETIPFKEKEIAPGVKKLSDEFDPLKYELYWHENGEIKEARLHLTDSIYTIYEWYENGQLFSQGLYNGCFEDDFGKRTPANDGLYTSWHENGQISGKGIFENGEKVGIWNNCNENGEKEEENFKIIGSYGYRNGRYIKWYKDGQKAIEGFYKKGKKNNIWAYWHENGQKWKEETFKDGKKDGKWTWWHENGQKSQVGAYKDGEKDGKWILYGENGEYGREDSYKDGEQIDEDDINWSQEWEL